MIEEKTIKKVAEVARLELTEDEAKKFSADLNNILQAFREIENARTDSVEPAFQPVPVNDILREDAIEKSLGQGAALSNSKNNKEEGYFKGPKAV